jgi:ATP-binding cassette subfamily C (CFTR/MRP) protein 4
MCRSEDNPPDEVPGTTTSSDENGPSKETPAAPSKRPENPYLAASFISRLCFLWPYPLLKLGMERPLEESDLAEVLEVDSSVYNRDYFNRMWENELRKHPKKPSLHRAILRDFFGSIWYVQPMLLLVCVARVVQAVVLGLLIDSFEGENDKGYLWAAIIVACGVVILFEHHQVFYITWRKGMQLRAACVAAIHEKSLRLSSTHQDTTASYGRIMNLASNDVERFMLAALFGSFILWAPVEAISVLIVGCLILGPAFAAGCALLVIVLVPLQIYLGGKFAFYRSKIAKITDKRVTFVSQAVRGARVMKMSGYEWRFLERIQELRRLEIAKIAKANNLKSWNESVFFATNVVVSITIFIVHIHIGGVLKTGDVFTVFTLINILQLELTKHVSLGVMGVSECYVSIGRIQKFLEFPELPRYEAKAELGPERAVEGTDGEVAISMSNVKSYWNEVNNRKPTDADDAMKNPDQSYFLALEDVSLDFRRGELTVIIGTVGSGKSALLQALVEELPVSSGTITRRYKTLAYACQEPWVMDGTVKENITMGLALDEKWYTEVVNACGLKMDFQQLRDGDQTIVGDRGVQCSGGQRARIGLARSIYRDPDVLVADDPLSAVDSKVGRQLFHEAIHGLMINRGKCVILATHQHQYVNDSRCVLVVQGRVGCIGSYEECVIASDGKLTAHAADDTVDSLTEGLPVAPILVSGDNVEEEASEDVDVSKVGKASQDNKEMNTKGVVSKDTYIHYVKAMGGIWVAVLLFVLFSATQASVLFTIITIGRWSGKYSSV